MRFDKAGSPSFVVCPPLRPEQPQQHAGREPPEQNARRARLNVAPNGGVERQASKGLGGCQVGAAPPDRPATNAAPPVRPATNAANRGEDDRGNRFQQAMETMQTGIETLEEAHYTEEVEGYEVDVEEYDFSSDY